MGDRIRQRRVEIGMTQTQLAGRLGVSYQQVQKYESGANRVAASRLVEIARVLEVPVGSFLPAATVTESLSERYDFSSSCLAAAHGLNEAAAALLSAARGKRALHPQEILSAIVDAALLVAEIDARPEDTELLVTLHRWAYGDGKGD